MKDTSTHAHNPDWITLLRTKGLRATTQRVGVLNFLHHNPHTNAEAIFQGVKAKLPTISIQAVHIIVQDLSGNGLLRRISLPDSASARYETRIEDNHHHIQCIHCGKTQDIDCVIGHAPCLKPSDSHGMRIIEASVIFSGVCRECEKPKSKKLTYKN